MTVAFDAFVELQWFTLHFVGGNFKSQFVTSSCKALPVDWAVIERKQKCVHRGKQKCVHSGESRLSIDRY